MYQIVETADGSKSVISEQFGVTYHSRHGAVQEAQHVFIEAALHAKMQTLKDVVPRPTLHILEMGFGSGLNALMTCLEAFKHQWQIHYTTLEAYPMPPEIAQKLGHGTYLEAMKENYFSENSVTKITLSPNLFFQVLHGCEWNKVVTLHPFFSFEKVNIMLQNLNAPNWADIIYFDAFAPQSQPELWDNLAMKKIYDTLKDEGMMTTYCAQGAFKRTLKSVGFMVEALPGPVGKREMTRARKTVSSF
jgi:tRNA U34 5-methylaminomethyl-2-thiouridine-forming methyltransferase MnmC